MIESLMLPLEELVGCEVFHIYNNSDTTSWEVTIDWKEPSSDLTQGEWDGVWNSFTQSGPLNKRFLEWAKTHYEYWHEKAHVPLNVVHLERKKDERMAIGW